jgi:hypothetical protein
VTIFSSNKIAALVGDPCRVAIFALYDRKGEFYSPKKAPRSTAPPRSAFAKRGGKTMTLELDRRRFLAAGAMAATLPLAGTRAEAQAAYPNKPIKIVVGYPAGGQTDIIARTYGEFVSRQLGQPVVVDNKAGAGGIIGAVEVKRAPADGYTLMCTISTTLVQNRVTVKNLPYDADKDFTLISALSQVGLVMWQARRPAPPI